MPFHQHPRCVGQLDAVDGNLWHHLQLPCGVPHQLAGILPERGGDMKLYEEWSSVECIDQNSWLIIWYVHCTMHVSISIAIRYKHVFIKTMTWAGMLFPLILMMWMVFMPRSPVYLLQKGMLQVAIGSSKSPLLFAFGINENFWPRPVQISITHFPHWVLVLSNDGDKARQKATSNLGRTHMFVFSGIKTHILYVSYLNCIVHFCAGLALKYSEYLFRRLGHPCCFCADLPLTSTKKSRQNLAYSSTFCGAIGFFFA